MIVICTSSLTAGAYRSKPKSDLRMVVVASKPIVSRLVMALTPALFNTTSSTTARVKTSFMPFRSFQKDIKGSVHVSQAQSQAKPGDFLPLS